MLMILRSTPVTQILTDGLTMEQKTSRSCSRVLRNGSKEQRGLSGTTVQQPRAWLTLEMLSGVQNYITINLAAMLGEESVFILPTEVLVAQS